MGRPRLSWIAVLLVASCSDDVGLGPDAPNLIDAPIPGTLSVAWTLEHEGTPLTCTQLGAVSVTVEIVREGEAFGVVDSFNCSSAMGISRDLAPGDYDLEITLAGSGVTLAGPTRRISVPVVSSQNTVVDPLVFDVDPSGTLVFRMTTGLDSCAPQPGGAGITATSIELRDAGGTCVPTTFEISAGATSGRPAGTYASDCAAATFGCIADDQDVTAMDVASGPRTMVITGLVGADACWNRQTSFSVRSAGLTTTLSPLVMVRNNTLCPP
jgi:hypothetical protein